MAAEGNTIAPQRQSQFELLRVVSMAMIVGVHYLQGSRGGALTALGPADINYYIAHAFESLCIVGVGCFVLITGYFQAQRQTAKMNRVVSLLASMTFYGLVFYAVAVALGSVKFGLTEILMAVFPFAYGRHWFVETYILLYLLSPLINLALIRLTERDYRTLLVALTLIVSVWPSFIRMAHTNDTGTGILTFVYLYAIGAYFSRFGLPTYRARWLLLLWISAATFTFAASLLTGHAWTSNFVFNVIGAVALFLAFSKFTLSSYRVNYLASFTFCVYLIHTDYSLNTVLWRDILRTQAFWTSPWFPVHFVGSVLVLFIAATGVDVGRRWVFCLVGPSVAGPMVRRWPMLRGVYPSDPLACNPDRCG